MGGAGGRPLPSNEQQWRPLCTCTFSNLAVRTATSPPNSSSGECPLYRDCGRNDLPVTSRSFLKTYPEYQKLFPTFANVPQAQLLKNGNFLAQSYTIAAGLNTIIQSLGSQELLAQEMNHLGTTHFSRGAQLHMFEVQSAYCGISYFH